ncbi:MAG TPA: CDP-glucose 4,6-dehydratase [Solirubrobacteraceae bacterium]|nr:CDP-glucose 4,6-dehydratase [Solirubrobacteraceae bacterium]
MAIDPSFWHQRRVLVTGHTGFKGAWLSLWLQSLGAQLTGLAAGSPTEPSLYELAGVGAGMVERTVDVRNGDAVRHALREAQPEVVLHLAAQPMVRRSLLAPAMTYEVNVMGTVNVLEAVRQAGTDVRVVVVVTSDKCYENLAGHRAAAGAGAAPRWFAERDPLGGQDPYSSSKACAELVAHAYRASFFGAEDGPRVGTARAGNVIGGGDWGEDRLIPDIVRAVDAGEPIKVRNPDAVRPWQHVLNPLSGYLALSQALWESDDAATAWNFGPRAEDARPVGWIVERLREHWGDALRWEQDGGPNPPEAGYLALDSGKAERELGWLPAWDLPHALERVVEWHEAHRRGENMRRVSFEQLERFV